MVSRCATSGITTATLVAAVTVLTSLDDQALAEVGICTPAQDTVLRQAAFSGCGRRQSDRVFAT